MQKYELMIILKGTLDEKAVKGVSTRVEGYMEEAKIKTIQKDDWGIRSFAYSINKENKGYYHVYTFESSSEGLGVLDTKLKLDVDVVRNLVTKL